MNVDPVVAEHMLVFQHQHDRQKIAVSQRTSGRHGLCGNGRRQRLRQLLHRGGRNHVIRRYRVGPAMRRAIAYGPPILLKIQMARVHFMPQQHGSAHLPHLPCASLPQHPGPLAWIAERVDQRLDDFLIDARRQLGRESVADRRAQRQALDALRRPVRRDFLAAHSPYLFGIGLKEDSKQAGAKLIGDPVLKTLWIGLRSQTSLERMTSHTTPTPARPVSSGLRKA